MSGSTAGMGLRPMLKMGMAEGVPDDISPDHLVGHPEMFHPPGCLLPVGLHLVPEQQAIVTYRLSSEVPMLTKVHEV